MNHDEIIELIKEHRDTKHVSRRDTVVFVAVCTKADEDDDDDDNATYQVNTMCVGGAGLAQLRFMIAACVTNLGRVHDSASVKAGNVIVRDEGSK